MNKHFFFFLKNIWTSILWSQYRNVYERFDLFIALGIFLWTRMVSYKKISHFVHTHHLHMVMVLMKCGYCWHVCPFFYQDWAFYFYFYWRALGWDLDPPLSNIVTANCEWQIVSGEQMDSLLTSLLFSTTNLSWGGGVGGKEK